MKSTATSSQTLIVNNVPPGSIMMWSGTGKPPNGWVLCDGTKGTPDLTDKFVYGSATPSLRGTTGGNTTTNQVTLKKENIPELTDIIDSSHSHAVNITSGSHNHGYASATMVAKTTQINFNMASSGDNIGLWMSHPPNGTTTASTVLIKGDTDPATALTATITVGQTSPTYIDITPGYLAMAFIMKK